MTNIDSAVVVLGRLIMDDIQYTDGRIAHAVAGGAGLHAAAGARLWWPRVAPVCGVGIDLHEVTQGMLREDGYVTAGLATRAERTVRSRLIYLPGGGRTETSVFGEAHFDSMATGPADIPPSLLPAVGTYVFHWAEPSFWSAVGTLRPRLGPVFWEMHADAAVPDRLGDVQAALGYTDMVSLNLAEANALFGAIAPQETCDRLLRMGAQIVVLRMGADGALAADRQLRLRVRPPSLRVVDETGAGNSFCGGFLAAWCLRPGDLAHALRCATGAASCTLERVGPARATDKAAAQCSGHNAIIVACSEQVG